MARYFEVLAVLHFPNRERLSLPCKFYRLLLHNNKVSGNNVPSIPTQPSQTPLLFLLFFLIINNFANFEWHLN